MKYARIIFLQGEEANEPLNILDEQGEQATFEYLQQWNHRELNEVERFAPGGMNDTLYKSKGYVMSYNLNIGYISLTKIIEI